jgi:hypothetical protein
MKRLIIAVIGAIALILGSATIAPQVTNSIAVADNCQ